MAHWKDAFPIDLAEESRHSRREFARFLALVSAGFTAGIGYLWARRTPLEGAPESWVPLPGVRWRAPAHPGS